MMDNNTNTMIVRDDTNKTFLVNTIWHLMEMVFHKKFTTNRSTEESAFKNNDIKQKESRSDKYMGVIAKLGRRLATGV